MNRIVIITCVSCLVVASGIGMTYYVVQAQQSQELAALTPFAASYRHLTAEVAISGATKASEAVALSFKNSGTVDTVAVQVGDIVSRAATLMTLQSSILRDQVAGAQATMRAQLARLRDLSNGTRPEQLAVTRAELASDTTTLKGAQLGLLSALGSAESAADVAVRFTIDQFITNPVAINSQFTISVSDNQLGLTVLDERRALGPDLSLWSTRIDSLQGASADDLLAASTGMHTHLQAVSTLLNGLTRILAGSSAASAAANQAAIAAARATITGMNDTVTAAEQKVQSAQAAIGVTERQLALEEAGATSDAVAAQQSVADSARAQVAELQDALADQRIVAPTSGIITAVAAKQGETVLAGAEVVSMIANGPIKIEGYVPEIHYSEIAVGESARIELDAFPGLSFPGTLALIDPTATLRDGVPNVKVTVYFTEPDSRIKPGLTARAFIQIADKPNALSIPVAAVTGTGSEATVLRVVGASAVRTKVVLGVTSTDGFVEVVSGLAAGDVVLVNETKQYRIVPN